MIRELYSRAVPSSMRTPIWHMKSLLRTTIFRESTQERRRATAELMLALGKGTARVRVNGLRLKVNLRDNGVGFPLYVNRSYESSETALLRFALKKGMCFVDVGANLGYYSTLASQAVGESGRVIAIEPDPYNYMLLSSNTLRNHLKNVSLHNLALGSSPGSGLLHLSSDNLGDHRLFGSDDSRKNIRVRIETLDNLLSSLNARPDFIKMDVQGFEYHVTQGMRKTLADDRPLVVMSEFWPSGLAEAGSSPLEFFSLMESFGFKASILLIEGKTQYVTFDQIMDLLLADSGRCATPEDAWVNLVFQR